MSRRSRSRDGGDPYPHPLKGQSEARIPSADKVVGAKIVDRQPIATDTGVATAYVELRGICRLYGASIKGVNQEIFEPGSIRLYPPGLVSMGWERAHEVLATGEIHEFQNLTWSGERYLDSNWFLVGRVFRDPDNAGGMWLDVTYEQLYQGYGDWGRQR